MMDASRQSNDKVAAGQASNTTAAPPNTTKGHHSKKRYKLALYCSLAIGILTVGLLVGILKFGWFDGTIGVTTALTQDEIVAEMSKSLTEQLISDAVTYKNSDATNRETARATMQTTAARRQTYIEILMRSDPDAFLRLAITPDIKQELLQEVESVETVVTLEGELTVIVTDAADNKEDNLPPQLFIGFTSDQANHVYLPESAPVHYAPNDQVRILGYQLGDAIVPNTVADSDNFAIIAAAEDLPEIGKRQVAAILINTSDTTAEANFTATNVANIMDDVADWYYEASYNKTYLTGKLDATKSADVFGPYTIAATSVGCPYFDYDSQGRAAAAVHGFSATGYQHVVIFVNSPSGRTCPFAGLATVGSNSFTMIVGVTNVTGATIHEMGHNFGLIHAVRNYDCKLSNGSAVVFGGTCSQVEYGDMHDTMGVGSYQAHFSAAYKYRLGWIDESNVTTVTQDGIYDLYPSDLNPISQTATQLIRVPLPYNIQFHQSEFYIQPPPPYYYYLEHRVGTSSTYINKNDFNGIFLRTGSGARASMTYLYQLGGANGLPGAEPCSGCDTGLRPGMIFEDPHNPDLSVKVLSWTPAKATLEIIVEPPPPVCTHSAPTINVNPTSGMTSSGGSIDYTVTVTSNDSPSCANVNYIVTPSSSTSGFTFSPSTQSWELAPGASNSRIFAVTSPGSAVDGIYTITFSVTSSEHPTPSTRNVSFVVIATTTPPIISISGVTDNETIRSDLNTKITATAAHSTGISKIEMYINGQLVARCNEPKNNTCDMFVKGSNTAVGTHVLKVTATAKDAAQTTVSLTFKR